MKSDPTIEINIPRENEFNTNKSSIIVSSLYDREQTYNYLEFNNSTERPFDGPSYLVGRAISETNRLHEKMNKEDIMLHLIICRFITTLSKNQRLEFAFIMELIRKKYGSVNNQKKK